MKTFARDIALLLAVCIVATPAGAADVLRWAGELGAGYDSNLGNAPGTTDRRESPFVTASGGAEVLLPLTLYTSVQLRSAVQGDAYARYDALSSVKPSIALRLYHRPGGGFFTPLLGVWASAAWWEFDSALRDSAEYRGGVLLVQQLTTRLGARLSAGASRREADVEAFDLEGTNAGFGVDWIAAERVTLTAGYQYYQGDVVATSRPTAIPAPVRTAAARDPALGEPLQWAYRLDAHTHVTSLGVNVALTQALSVDVFTQRADASGGYGTEYERWLTIAGLLARY